MRELGTESTDIANHLNLNVSTVRRNYKKVQKTGDFYAKPPRPGRPRALSPRSLRRAKREITSGQARDGADVQRQLFPNVGASTIRHNLSEMGLKGCMRRKKPLLTKVHIKKRKLWAQCHNNWTVDNWKAAVFSDESKFNLFGSDGRLYCRRRPGDALLPQNVHKTVKHGGGNLQVWGCLTWNGTGHLHRIDGRMDAVQYCNILDKSLLGTLEDQSTNKSDIIFVQDNDPKHTSKCAVKWFQDHNLKVLDWAPSSPDMNIIEHAWDELDRCLRSRNPLPRNLDELWDALVEEWGNLDLSYVRKLYNSMPH